MSKYKLSFKSANELLKYIEEQDIQYVDFNFTDIRGAWHHISQHASSLNKDVMADGILFDASSIAGWKAINDSDMVLKPDIDHVTYDPFSAQKTIKIFCDVYNPARNTPYELDPRSLAKAAHKYLKSSGVGDNAFFGPELEFFVFDSVTVETQGHHVAYKVDSEEGPYNTGRDYPTGNMGHRPAVKGGYVPESPVDSLSDIRAEMLSVIESMGVTVEKHHHEVAPSQCELGIRYDDFLTVADNVQIYKHAVRNVAHSYGKTATFMPKPINGDNGSGMHVHQSIWKAGKPVFAGDQYADLSETALYYIGGILMHARSLNAFTNPSTNSYKRLVPGFEAPVLLTYSARNRSAACRIPFTKTPAAKRVEVRFPDATSNAYLSFAAMLMAGLDGIENKIHPGDAMDLNLYDLEEEQQKSIPNVCSSLSKALDSLKNDHDYLLKGNVFTQELIDSFIALKEEEIGYVQRMTHPAEVALYYSK